MLNQRQNEALGADYGARPAAPAGDTRGKGLGVRFAGRQLAAAGVLALADWLTVLACLAVAWGVRNGPLQTFFPALGPLRPFWTYVRNLYFLLPWTLAFAEAQLYNRRALFWSETRRVLRACTLAALFAVFLSL